MPMERRLVELIALGNFFGGREVLDALRGAPSLTDMRRAASREVKYGPGSRAAQEGDVNTSLMDLVDYAEDGTVQGMGPNRFMDERGTGQLVYDPSAVIPGLPYLQDPQNDVFVPQYDPSRESAVGRGLQRGVDFIGQGGMMGAVTRGLGALSDDLGGGDKSSNLSNEVTDSGITNALMGGADSVNKLTSNELANLPQFAGGYTGSGVNNPFLSSSQREALTLDGPTRMSQQGPNFTPQRKPGMTNYADRNTPLFNALGLPEAATTMQMPFQDGRLSDAFLFREEQSPLFEDAIFEQMMPPVGYSLPSTSDDRNIVPDRIRQTALENQALREKGRREGTSIDLLERDYSGIDDVNVYDDPPLGAGAITSDISVSPNADMITGRPTFAFQDENFGRDSDVTDFRDYSGLNDSNLSLYQDLDTPPPEKTVSPYGGQEFPLLDRERPSFPVPETSSAFPSRASEPTTLFPSGSSDANNILGIEAVTADARTKRLAKLNTSDNTMFGTDDLRDPVETIYDDASQLEDLMTTGAIDPSAANIGVGGGDGGGGGGPVQCPPGYEPMILESGETVCVPITEDEEVMDEGEVITAPPVTRPTISDSPYTPQAVSNIAPYRLQPGSSGGGLADILQLQNYPTIV
jgi:hypothetical protein